jgi:hypothetical protein
MAVRFSALGQDYTTTAAILTQPLTVLCWLKLASDRNTYSTVWSSDSNSSTYFVLGTDTDGTGLRVSIPSGDTFPLAQLTLNTWYRTAVTVSGTTNSLYLAAHGSALTFQDSVTGAIPSSSATFRVGAGPLSAEWLDGSVANLKHYSAVLTTAEMETELYSWVPVRTANLVRSHRFVGPDPADYSGNGYALSGGSGATADTVNPPILWVPRQRTRMVMLTPQTPTVDVGRDVFGTAGFEFSIQAVESGLSITDRSWTVVSGPAQVAEEIGTTSLLSWFPATPGVYELEYRVTNAAGQAYDTVYATVNATGTVVNSASAVGTSTTLTCSKPSGTAEGDVMLAVQSGDFNDFDLMTSPNPWQPLFEYDVGLDSLHIKTWTLTAGVSEPASYDFTQGAGSAGTVTIVAMRGVVEAGVRFEITADTSTGTTRTAPTVAGAVPGSILLCGAMTDPLAPRSWTPPTGMTEQADVQSSTSTTHSVASLLDPGDPTGAKNFTLSNTTAAPGGIQWSAVFPMPPDPPRRGANKSMFTVVRTN